MNNKSIQNQNSGQPELRVAAVFSSHMVLQRQKPIQVWGWGKNGSIVHLRFGSFQGQTTITNGQWGVIIPPHNSGQTHTMEIWNKEKNICFEDIVLGEVWLAGGQSNMELSLKESLKGEKVAASFSCKDIRYYQVPKTAVLPPEKNIVGEGWIPCENGSAAAMSAVGFYFARHLLQELDVPVGIILCNWGGTSISAWMSDARLKKSTAGQQYLSSYTNLVGSKTDEQYDAEMNEYLRRWNQWDACVQACRRGQPDISWEALNAECGLCPWPQPAGSKSPFRPAGLYASMLRQAAPYTLRGFIYYQGEEDVPRHATYGEMMCYLVAQWRADWLDDTLPFLFVQLPGYTSKAEAENGFADKSWCFLQEQQQWASRFIANSGMAVTIDCGEFDNIHPVDKRPVGHRLALQALAKVYGKPIVADSPFFTGLFAETGSLRLHFACAEDGLIFKGEPDGFEIAGEDGRYFPASASIEGNTIVLSCPQVPNPSRARYAWVPFGPTPLYGKTGLPAAPFRSHRQDA